MSGFDVTKIVSAQLPFVAQSPANADETTPVDSYVPSETPVKTVASVKSWRELGLKASPKDFNEYTFAFAVEDSSGNGALPFVSPLDTVTLAGNPEIKVPWTDRYLVREWEAFLQEKVGMKLERETTNDGHVATKFFYNDKLVMASYDKKGARSPDADLVYVLFDVDGNAVKRIELKKPESPKIAVMLSDEVPPDNFNDIFFFNKQIKFSTITVHGHSVNVLAYFPPESSVAARTNLLGDIAAYLQTFPKDLVLPMLESHRFDGAVTEGPILFMLSDAATAEKIGLLREEKKPPKGLYNPVMNFSWFNISYDKERDSFFIEGYPHFDGIVAHEVMGHAVDDFAADKANSAERSSPDDSAVRDYYVWKIAGIFTPDELTAYNKILRPWSELYIKKVQTEDEKAKVKQFEEELAPFREKLLKHFPSKYAGEGAHELIFQMVRPVEHFAETVHFTYLTTQYDDAQMSWLDMRRMEPMSRLLVLDYLMKEYQTDHIGTIEAKELYSKKAFKEVLGIEIENANERLIEVGLAAQDPAMKAAASRLVDGWNINLHLQGLETTNSLVPRIAGGFEFEFGRPNFLENYYVDATQSFFLRIGTTQDLSVFVAAGLRGYFSDSFSHQASIEVDGILPDSMALGENNSGVMLSYAMSVPLELWGYSFDIGAAIGVGGTFTKGLEARIGGQLLLPLPL